MCECLQTEQLMNRMGPRWCEQNIDLLTEKVVQNNLDDGRRVGMLERFGIKLLLEASIRASEGLPPTIEQSVVIFFAAGSI